MASYKNVSHLPGKMTIITAHHHSSALQASSFSPRPVAWQFAEITVDIRVNIQYCDLKVTPLPTV
jgi:hypothetical protein